MSLKRSFRYVPCLAVFALLGLTLATVSRVCWGAGLAKRFLQGEKIVFATPLNPNRSKVHPFYFKAEVQRYSHPNVYAVTPESFLNQGESFPTEYLGADKTIEIKSSRIFKILLNNNDSAEIGGSSVFADGRQIHTGLPVIAYICADRAAECNEYQGKVSEVIVIDAGSTAWGGAVKKPLVRVRWTQPLKIQVQGHPWLVEFFPFGHLIFKREDIGPYLMNSFFADPGWIKCHYASESKNCLSLEIEI